MSFFSLSPLKEFPYQLPILMKCCIAVSEKKRRRKAFRLRCESGALQAVSLGQGEQFTGFDEMAHGDINLSRVVPGTKDTYYIFVASNLDAENAF